MFRIPSEARKAALAVGWFPLFWSNFLGLQHPSELDHTSSESEIRHVAPPSEDRWEDRPATDFFYLGSWSWSSLQISFEAPGNYIIRIQRNKGNAGHKMSCTSDILSLLYTMHCTPWKAKSYLNIQLWHWPFITLESDSEMKGFGQINWMEFQPGLAETTTLITLPIKISDHPNARLLDDWRHIFNRSHQIVFRCSLSPKWPFWSAAILDCLIGIYGNHAMILGNQTCLHRGSE